MPIVGTKTIKLSKIVLPGDFKARLTAPHVADLAASVQTHGLMHPPTVEAGTMRLLAGHDRVAALMAAGVKSVTVNLAEGDERELERLSIAENLHRRRDDEVALRRRYLGEIEREIVAETLQASETVDDTSRNYGDSVPLIRPGRPKTPKGAARERVARETGVTPAALKKADQRAAKAAEPEEPAAPPPPPIRTLGVELPDAMAADVAGVQRHLDAIDQYLRRSQGELTALGKEHGGAIAHARLQRLQREVHSAASLVRGSRPDTVCAYCKLEPTLQDVCNGCGGLGYLTADQVEHVPRELLDEDAMLVAVHGILVHRNEGAATWRAAPANPGRQRRLRVEDEDGRDLNTDEAEEAGF